MVADIGEKDVWDSGSCRLFLHFLGKNAVKKCLGKRLEVPDILLPTIRGLLSGGHFSRLLAGLGVSKAVFTELQAEDVVEARHVKR